MAEALLYGIHDPGGEDLLPAGSWIVFTEAIGCDPNDLGGKDFRQWSERGYNVIVRLNNGYGATGTIPTAGRYGDFALRCANYVRNSAGCTRWIVGNEPNHSQERPEGQPISAMEYAGCFKMVAREVFERVGEQHEMIVAAVAPWNMETGDWLLYMRWVLENLRGYADGIALHTYTHGSDPALVTSEATMDAPFERRRFHFRAYRDLMGVIPDAQRDLPVYITETDQDVAWADANSGWVQAAYGEIDAWNRTPGNQAIQCLALYRWPNVPGDKWGIESKVGVHDDLRAAVARGYSSPDAEKGDLTPSPSPHGEGSKAGDGDPIMDISSDGEDMNMLVWDKRLDQRGVNLLRASGQGVGSVVYRLMRGEYLTPEESGGNPLIWVDVLDEHGVRMVGAPVVQSWSNNSALQLLEEKRGEPAGTGFLMTAPGNAYDVRVGGGVASDVVRGMGLGTIENPWGKDHVGYRMTFQRVVEREKPGVPKEPQPVEPEPAPLPPVIIQPTVTGILDPLVMEAILDIESNGDGIRNGRVVIRFEPATFRKHVDAETFKKHFRYGDPVWTQREFNHGGGWRSMEVGGQDVQWEAFELAKSLHAEGAALSISMGVGQIMGFNHESVGYASALEMLQAFESENAQLIATFNFVLARPELVKAVANRDWRTIALRYNGPGNVDHYSMVLAERYRVLRSGQ